MTARYVIIQSLDTSAERLCIAEACVIEAGEYAIVIATGLEKKLGFKEIFARF